MKKTLTVNLGGTVYHIDEDAYNLLDNYLNNLRFHFRKNEAGDEIVRDMENRIAELLNEYISKGQQVITIENVEAVISRMGKPEELNSEFEDEAENAESKKTEEPVRRLFRNPDDKILGGVASGLAAYFGWDATWLRIALIIPGCFIHGLFIAYIIAWIIIPQARTATEKLQMSGRPINMENIGRTVTDGFERTSEFMKSEKPRSFLHNLGNILVSIVGFLVKVFLVIIAICIFPALFLALVVLFALFMAATGILISIPAAFYSVLPGIEWGMVSSMPGITIALSVCGLLAAGIPAFGLLQLILQSFGVWKPMSTATKIILTLLWIIATVLGFIFILQAPFIEFTGEGLPFQRFWI